MSTMQDNARQPRQQLADASRLLEELVARVERLEAELMMLRAERTAQRIDSGEGMVIPAEVARRVFVEGITPIRAFREWRGLTQEELGRRIGVAKSYVSQLETRRRKPGVATLKKLAAALDVPFDLLME